MIRIDTDVPLDSTEARGRLTRPVQAMAQHARGNRLWAITSYFNPAGYRNRRENYRLFRERLAVPLVTVEWARDGRFALGPEDAEVLVQVSGGDVLWQKERLLNVALRHLPDDCD